MLMKKILLIGLGLVWMNTTAQDTVKIKTALTPEQEAENAYNVGLEYMSKKEFNGAIENFSKAISLNPLFDKAYTNRGFAKYENKGYDASILDFNKAIEIKALNLDALFGKAQSFYAMKKTDSCIAYLNKVTLIDEAYSKAFYLSGQIKFEAEQYKEAITDYNHAITSKADYAYAYKKDVRRRSRSYCRL
jgi:tetratricopeptide (TPR) repeat protein